MFRFAYYLGWREYVRTQVQLLRLENEEDTRRVVAFLNEVTRALASDRPDGQQAMAWSDEQRGIGKLMTEQQPGASFMVCGLTGFHRDYDKVFAEWMERFADGLYSLDVESGNRLRLVKWALYGSYGCWTRRVLTAAGGLERAHMRSAQRHRRKVSRIMSKTSGSTSTRSNH